MSSLFRVVEYLNVFQLFSTQLARDVLPLVSSDKPGMVKSVSGAFLGSKNNNFRREIR